MFRRLRDFVILIVVLSVFPASSVLAVALPENGQTQQLTAGEPIAPLQIVTSGEAANYFVKLSEWKSDKTVMTVFVRAGETVTARVPLGAYRIKYAAGQDWQGETALFGEATQYFIAEKRFDFIRKGNQVAGFMIELILQADGNLSTKQISKGDW